MPRNFSWFKVVRAISNPAHHHHIESRHPTISHFHHHDAVRGSSQPWREAVPMIHLGALKLVRPDTLY